MTKAKEEAPDQFILDAYEKRQSMNKVSDYVSYRGYKSISVEKIRAILKVHNVTVNRDSAWRTTQLILGPGKDRVK